MNEVGDDGCSYLVSCVACLGPEPAPRCFFLCEPKLKVEPTFTWENWARAPRIQVTDGAGNTSIVKLEAESIFETVIAVDIPTTSLGGDQSRRSYLAPQLRGRSMTIELSSSPSAAARYTGSSRCLQCHKNEAHCNKTAHKLGWTVPQAPGSMQDFSRHPEFFNALQSFPSVEDYTRGTRLELGDYDATRGDDKFKLRLFGDTRVPIDAPYADVYL